MIRILILIAVITGGAIECNFAQSYRSSNIPKAEILHSCRVDVLDERVSAQKAQIEERLGQKLDSQHGILVALIDRVRSVDNEIIRQDTLLKTILGVPQLMNTDRIAKADRDDQRKD